MISSAKPSPGRNLEPTVFVVDDDVSVRESLEMLIREAGWKPQVFSSAQAFLAHPRVNAPRCLVLDMTLPGESGLDLQKAIVTDQFCMPIIFITGYGDVPGTVQAMKAGAFEFLTKPFAQDVLLNAIQSAIDRSQAALFAQAELESLRASYLSLTPRERDVMELVVCGLLNKQVAAELGISVITVKAHRGSVMRKMAAASLADLMKINARLHLARTSAQPAGPARATARAPEIRSAGRPSGLRSHEKNQMTSDW